MSNISELNLYDEEAIFTHVKNLEFKRLASTEGETKAINYIQKELEKKNIIPSIESFTWTKSMQLIMKMGFLFILFYVVMYQAIILFFPEFSWIILILDGLFAVCIYFAIKKLFDMSNLTSIGKKRQSKNVIANLPAKNISPSAGKSPIIIFSAHYDSISLKYPYRLQLLLYIAGGLLALSYLLLTLVLSIWALLNVWNILLFTEIFFLLRNISFYIGVVIGVILIFILFNKRTNESPGSIDNATGVAILIELAKLLADNPLNHIDCLFLWCSAEEWGLWGSRNFCAEHFEDLAENYDLDNSYNINIDMVGTYLGLVNKTGIFKRKKMNRNLNDIFISMANKQNIPLETSFIPIGAASDHRSFKAFANKYEKQLQVSCFLSHKDAKHIHSEKDKAEKCDKANLNNCCNLLFHSIKSLDVRVE